MTESGPVDTMTFASAQLLNAKSNGFFPVDHPDVERALRAATSKIRKRARWHIWPVMTKTVRLNGPGTKILQLPAMHLTEVASIVELGKTINLSRLDIGYDDGQIGGRFWTDRLGAITATFTAGYEEIPDELEGLVLEMTARALGSPLGAIREQTLSSNVTWSATAPNVAGGTVILDHEFADVDEYRYPGAS